MHFLAASALLALTSGPARAQDPATATLAGKGAALADATVTDVVVHPEFHRLYVALPDGRTLPLEITVARQDSSPACVHHGLAVYPRWELLAAEGQTPTVDPAGAPATRALCALLEADGKDLDIGILQKAQPDQAAPPPPELAPERANKVHLPTAAGFTWRPLHLLPPALLLAGLAALLGPVRRGLAAAPLAARLDLLLVMLLSVAARAFSTRALLVAPDAGFERIEMAWDMAGAHPLYGGGFGALHAPVQLLTGFDPDAVFLLHLALSALAAPVLWGLAWMLTRDRVAAAGAGVALALLPVALRLAGSELEHVPLASLELLAAAAAWAWWRTPGTAHSLLAVAVGAGTLAAHLRPEALAFALLPLGLLAVGAAARWRAGQRLPAGMGLAAVLLLTAAVAVRALSLETGAASAVTSPESSPLALLDDLFQPRLVLPQLSDAAEDRGQHQVFLDLGLTPLALPLLALLGLIHGIAHGPRRRLAVVAAWWALCLLPVFPKTWPQVDAWRLQLPAQAPLILLAALGLAALASRPRLRLLALAAIPLTTLPLLPFSTRVWAGQAEWQALPELIGRLPPTAVVYVPDHEVHASKVLQVGALLARRGGVPRPDWRPLSPFVAQPDPGADRYAWVNLSCRITELPGRGVANDAQVNPCLQLEQRCRLTPFATTELPAQTDLDLSFPTLPVEVGFYRIDGCDGSDPPVDRGRDGG